MGDRKIIRLGKGSDNKVRQSPENEKMETNRPYTYLGNYLKSTYRSYEKVLKLKRI
jgi:hypothetical protein